VFEVSTNEVNASTLGKVTVRNGLQSLCFGAAPQIAPAWPRLVASRQLPTTLAVGIVSVENTPTVCPVLNRMTHVVLPFCSAFFAAAFNRLM